MTDEKDILAPQMLMYVCMPFSQTYCDRVLDSAQLTSAELYVLIISPLPFSNLDRPLQLSSTFRSLSETDLVFSASVCVPTIALIHAKRGGG
jgi:hypothetical protein